MMNEVKLHEDGSLEDVNVLQDQPNSTARKSTVTKKQKASYKPYKTSTLETPLLHYLSSAFSFGPNGVDGKVGFPTKFYALRWMLTYPLQRRMPGLLSDWTIGEVCLVLPWVFVFVVSLNLTFLNPSVTSSGDIAGYPLVLMYLTATRTNSLFSFLFGIPFERMLFYHKLSAVVTALTGFFHLYVAYYEESHGDRRLFEQDSFVQRHLSGDDNEGLRYAAYGPDPDLVKFLITGDTNMSGSMIIVSYIAIFVTSYVVVRRIAFEFFYLVHILFAGVSLFFALKHGVNMVLVFVFWGVDIIVRLLLLTMSKSSKQKAAVRRLPGGITELSFPKTFEYNAGQYIFICVPKLSILQWHPFSISSSPDQDTITIHFKALGGWTKALYALAKEKGEISIITEGPYGAPSVDLESDRYKLAILASGGIGVTPMYSLCNDLLYKKSLGRDIQKIAFIWSARKPENDEIAYDSEAGSAIALPSAFSPNLFVNPHDGSQIVRSSSSTDYSNEGVLFAECYMTGTEKNVKSNLPGVKYGRPKFNRIFERMKATAQKMGEKRVAVCVCGPQAMIDLVRYAAVQHSKNGVYFDVHSELFEF